MGVVIPRMRSAWGLFRWGALLIAGAGVFGACGRAPLGENPIESAECGDGICAPRENSTNCPADCYCGDNVCSDNEGGQTCSVDCRASCGDGDCDDSETAASCPRDCSTTASCGDGPDGAAI